jgi:hypothetical protein
MAVVRFIIFIKRATVNGAFVFYIYKTRSASPFTCAGFGRNVPLPVARFVRTTSSGALPFVYLKFYVSHSYF